MGAKFNHLNAFVSLILPQTYVRDIYPFRRSVSPQLNLVHMHPEKGQELIQKQVTDHLCFILWFCHVSGLADLQMCCQP